MTLLTPNYMSAYILFINSEIVLEKEYYSMIWILKSKEVNFKREAIMKLHQYLFWNKLIAH